MRWVKWNSASRSSWIVTFSKPAGTEKRRYPANKDTYQSLHLNFAKALHSVGMRLLSLPLGSVVKKGIWWFSACLTYRRRHQEAVEECDGIPVHDEHQTRYTQSVSLPCCLRQNRGWHRCIWGKDRTTTSWVLAPKPPEQLGMLSPDLCGGHRLFSHTPASLAPAAEASAALTSPVSLRSGGGHSPPFFTHSGLSCPQ